MVPADSDSPPRIESYSGSRYASAVVAYGTFTPSGRRFHAVRLTARVDVAVLQPRGVTPPVWARPRSLAATDGIEVSFSSSGY